MLFSHIQRPHTSYPQIYHGNTLTSGVSLRDVCEAIHKYAFVVSPYPVIISAEVHCGLGKQEQIYSVLVEVFGDTLIQSVLGRVIHSCTD